MGLQHLDISSKGSTLVYFHEEDYKPTRGSGGGSLSVRSDKIPYAATHTAIRFPPLGHAGRTIVQRGISSLSTRIAIKSKF